MKGRNEEKGREEKRESGERGRKEIRGRHWKGRKELKMNSISKEMV